MCARFAEVGGPSTGRRECLKRLGDDGNYLHTIGDGIGMCI